MNILVSSYLFYYQVYYSLFNGSYSQFYLYVITPFIDCCLFKKNMYDKTTINYRVCNQSCKCFVCRLTVIDPLQQFILTYCLREGTDGLNKTSHETIMLKF